MENKTFYIKNIDEIKKELPNKAKKENTECSKIMLKILLRQTTDWTSADVWLKNDKIWHTFLVYAWVYMEIEKK